MKIGKFGEFPFFAEKLTFDSARALTDFDALVADIEYFFKPYVGKDCIPSYALRWMESQKAQLFDFLDNRDTFLIAFAPAHTYFKAEHPDFPDTEMINFNPTVLISRTIFTTQEQNGKEIEIAKTAFSSFFEQYREYISFDCYIDKPVGQPLLTIPHSKKIVSTLIGRTLIIPRMNIPTHLESNFFEELFEILELFTSRNSKFLIPDWVDRYLTDGEKSRNDEREKLMLEKSKLETQINEINIFLNGVREVKGILADTGDSLEKRIESILLELGASVEL